MENNMSMEELLNEQEGSQVRVGDVVTGEVVSLHERVAYVDINQPTEGQIYLNYFTNDKDVESFAGLLKVGDKVTAKVTRISETKTGDSVILLSCLDMIKDEELNKLNEQVKLGTVDVTATVVKVNEKSYELRYNGLRLFMSIRDSKEPFEKGANVLVRITEVNLEKRFAFCSHYLIVKEQKEKEHAEYLAKKEAEHKAYEEARAAEVESLHVGDTVEAVVSKILNYGVLVKLDKAQGLIKMRDLDHKFVKNPTEIVKVGDKVTVKVTKNEDGKLEFSRKACIDSPYQVYKKSHNVGDTVSGKVVNKLPFGLLVELAPEVTALLHKSEFSWNPNDNLMASTLIGDTIEAAILKMDDENEKVNLSKRVLIDNPWSRVEANVGDVCEALITEVSSRGLKVEAYGVDGFIPARAVVLDGKSNKIEDYYAVGDKITALVSEVNPRRWILTLDQKAYKNQQERLEFDKYMNTQEEEKPVQTIGDLLGEELKK
jgi:small subunit ribosomal protein S1